MENKIEKKVNWTLLTDFYEITMANGYLETGMQDTTAVFDMFFRQVPDGGGYAIMAGLEQLIEYLKNLKFEKEDIEFLRSKSMFSEKFLEYLGNFQFECDVWAVPEGTPIFPNEPIVTVKGPVIQAQFIETMVLLTINHQSLIATKANRICRAAAGVPVMEFGTRRAHGVAAAVLGARAAYIGGCSGTACTVSDRDYGIKALGTMAHSWVQMFPTEYDAFKKYSEMYPDNCILLVDTYNVLKSGVPNAIKIFGEMKAERKELEDKLKSQGREDELANLSPLKFGIRIDSGDIAYLTKKARKMLDDAGFPDCNIVASNSLDEYIIRGLKLQDAKIDSYGVGERLITAKSEPVFGGVYKLVALGETGKPQCDDQELKPKIKISENVEKITNPGFKKVYRFFDKDTGRALADLLALAEEPAPSGEEYEIFDSKAVWKRNKLTNYDVRELQVQIFRKGKCVYESPDIDTIKEYCEKQIGTLWNETLRLENPEPYYVDLSEKLWNMKNKLLREYSK